MTIEASGYLHAAYARSLSEFAQPRRLPQSQGWLLLRTIPGTAYSDAMGPYPLFACKEWGALETDLADLGREIVSLVLITDPFGAHSPSLLQRCFPDVMRPFKEHYVADLAEPWERFTASDHLRKARKALSRLRVETCERPEDCLDEWDSLYDNLIARHKIQGLRAFSRSAFAQQLAVPGMVLHRARCGDETVGMVLWYVQGDVAYYHLGAYAPLGYEIGASFALFAHAMQSFSATLRWLDLGAGAGLASDGTDGLSRFKRGWTNRTLPAYLCGRVFDRDRYQELVRARGGPSSDFFPAYRDGVSG
ncbi:MAG TPA: GNAT family N-acetyltransferase [Oscillatoriaceae cyanobacterium]